MKLVSISFVLFFLFVIFVASSSSSHRQRLTSFGRFQGRFFNATAVPQQQKEGGVELCNSQH
jgi:hypothetical protein